MPKGQTCTYHCRSCENHFTSLAAFDLHRKEYKCINPDEINGLHKIKGTCSISGPNRLKATIYQLEAATSLKEYYDSKA